MRISFSRLLRVASAAFFVACAPALAQPTTPDHSIAVGRGAGQSGFKSVGPCAANQPIVGTGSSTDPVCGIPTVEQTFSTRTLAQAATISSAVTVVTLNGYSAAGDEGMGAQYVRIATPSPAKSWQFASADGQWWGLNVATINPGMVGAVGNGVANDTTPVSDTCAYVVANHSGGIKLGRAKNYLVWPAGTNVTGGQRICDLSSTFGVKMEFNGSLIFTNNNFAAQAGQAYAILLVDALRTTIEGFNLSHTGTLDAANCSPSASGLSPSCGFIGVYLAGSADKTLITNASQVGGVTAIAAAASSISVPVKNTTVLGLTTDTVYYALNPVFAHGFFARGVRTHNVGRSLIATNSQDVDVEIYSDAGGPFNDLELDLVTHHLGTGLYNSLSNIKVVYNNNARSTNVSAESLARLTFAQGTGTSTAASIKNIKLWFNVENDANQMPKALLVTKSTDATVRGYVLDGLEIGGKFNNYNFGIPLFDMFNDVSWAGETVRNVVFRDVVATGSSSSVSIDAAGIVNNLVLENVVSNFNWTITNAGPCVLRTTNIKIPNITEFRATAGKTSGCVTSTVQDAAGTYNWNLPTTAGTANQGLISGAGGSSPMGWATVAIVQGGVSDNAVVRFDGTAGSVQTSGVTIDDSANVTGAKSLTLSGSSSGVITMQPQAAAGTFNWNLPITAGTSGQPLLSGGGGAAAMTFGTLGVAAGGTGLTAGTSGGVPYYSSTSSIASSGLLTLNALLLGGGAAGAPAALGSLGTTTTVLHGNAAGAPSFAAVTGSDMATNTVANSNLAQMAANTIKGNNTGSTANAADLTVGQVSTLLGLMTEPGGRLTLTTAVPVLTADVTAATTIFYTPYRHAWIALYDGTNWRVCPFSELSNITSNSSTGNAGPAAVTTNSNYDLFVWSTSSDCSNLTLTRGPVWTSDTARSAGTALVRQNGIYINNASITNGPNASRGTYVGTVRSNGSSQIDYKFGSAASGGGAAVIGLWNMYNRVRVEPKVTDSTASWTYNSATVRSMNNSATNRISVVRGLDEDAVSALLAAMGSGTAGDGSIVIGLDSTSTESSIRGYFGNGTTDIAVRTFWNGLPGLGFHFLQAEEVAHSAATITLKASAVYQQLTASALH